MRIPTGAGAFAVMGPAVLSFHNKGTLLSQHSTHVTAKRICHRTRYISEHNIHVMAQCTCDSSGYMSHHTCHSTLHTSQSKQSMQRKTQTQTQTAYYGGRGLAQHICSTNLHTCCLTALLQSTCAHMADMHMCRSQEAMQAILLMRINCCKQRMTTRC